MSELPNVQNIDHAKLRPLIEKARQKIKSHDVVKDILDKYDVDESEIDLIPICFAHMDTSARTDHCVIYININLLKDPGDIDHYLVHEITHYFQQSCGDGPTQGADDGVYLDNDFEIEGFQNQSEYLSDTRDDEEAEKYIEKVLDHHDVNSEKERERRKKELLQLASRF